MISPPVKPAVEKVPGQALNEQPIAPPLRLPLSAVQHFRYLAILWRTNITPYLPGDADRSRDWLPAASSRLFHESETHPRPFY